MIIIMAPPPLFRGVMRNGVRISFFDYSIFCRYFLQFFFYFRFFRFFDIFSDFFRFFFDFTEFYEFFSSELPLAPIINDFSFILFQFCSISYMNCVKTHHLHIILTYNFKENPYCSTPPPHYQGPLIIKNMKVNPKFLENTHL